MTLQDVKENLHKQVKRHFQCGADPTMIRASSENDPRMIRKWKRKPQPASQVRLLCEVPRSIFYCKIQRFAPNLTLKLSPNTAPATKSATWTSPSTAPATKSATWTSPSTAPATKNDTWTSPSSAPATKSDTWTSPITAPATKSETWTSPNTAPATKNDSTALSSSHIKRHCQCAEQQVSLSNLAKYCACHEKWHCKISKKISKNRWNVISNAGPIRAWSDHNATMKPTVRNPPRNRGYFSNSARAFSFEKYKVLRPILHSNIHQMLHLPPKSATWNSPNTAPATKSDTWTSPSSAPSTKCDTWTSLSTAPATKSATWTSPNTAPATRSDTWTSPSSAPATKSDTWTSPSTAPATKSDTWTSPSTAPATKSDTWTSPSTAPATVL